jgi:photosystem II stability/assembly factor-like uncharacterized protein
MKVICLYLLLVLVNVGSLFGQSSAFTYQGKLNDGGSPANGQYDLVFRIFDTDTNPTPLAPEQIVDNVPVTAGIFNVELSFDFGPFTTIAAQWIEVGVRPGASTGSFTRLTPRQHITSSPYSMQSAFSAFATIADTATNADNAANAANADAVGGTPAALIIKEGDLRLTDARPPTADSPSYVNINPAAPQPGGFDVVGNARIGSTIDVFGVATLRSNVNVFGTINGNGSGIVNVDAAKLGTFPAADYTRFKWNVVVGNQQAVSNNGYVFDTNAAVEVTLPSAPNVGDIVRVALTGGGTFLVKPNAGQTISRPEDLTASWVDVGPIRSWQSISMSADAAKLFAVQDGGSIWQSIDSGQTWTPVGPSPVQWSQIVSTDGGTKVYATEIRPFPAPMNLYTSTDSGATWSTPVPLPAGAGRLASSSDGTNLAFVGVSDRIYTSTNSGASWTPHESVRQWSDVASSANGLKLVAAHFQGQLYTSTDGGVNWTPRETNRNWGTLASSADGSVLVATVASTGQVFVSTDSGVIWTERPNFPGSSIGDVAMSADGRKIATVSNSARIHMSSDFGVTWGGPPTIGGWTSIASSADGNTLAATAAGMGGRQIYLRRSNIFTGGVRGYGSIELIHMGGGKFLIVNSVGALTFQ